ncbi:MAG: acetoacetate--CoA ligase [Acidimicrobiia bacterium]|nr:MAG: acetoacetate--CoA ligase [Acidimicrobiia bacterium]
MSEILWEPSPQAVESALITSFARRLGGFDDYHALWRWSIDNRGEFWQAVWDDSGVIAEHLADRPIGAEGMPGTEWFPGARLNFAENLLRHIGSDPAIVHASESSGPATISRDQLRALVARARAGLLRLGVRGGDRVAALLPNRPEAVIGALAASSIGAVWSSCSPDFGPTGVIDRFGQIEPKVLITASGYEYNGRRHDVTATVERARREIPAIEHAVAVGEPLAGAITWDDLLSEDGPLEFAALPFDYPLYVLYSSGTTGRPKSIVHGAGGTLLKHLCEHRLHCDLRPGDRLFWFTTCGWMMWNWLVSGLASGAAIVLYDGSPSHPSLETLWRLADQAGITHFGASPRFLAANANAGIVPREVARLDTVRWLGSTGAPLNPDQFDRVYADVKGDVQLASISGGTDIIGCFALGVPTLPVRRGELQARALGMAVEAWDESDRPVVGEKGELVCTRPFPSMPVGFWGDPDGSRYRAAYFEEHPGVWTHGDFIEIRPEGGVVIYGRSDTTLNPGGVRIGTAELYRAVEPMAEVADCIAVGRDVDGDVEMILFVVPAPGVALDDDLIARIKRRIREEASPRHVPHRVFQVGQVPYTISGKKVEKAVRAVVSGEPVTNRDALANPEALDEYARFAGG